MKLIKVFSIFLIIASLFCKENKALAAKSYGRFVFGGFTATEKFTTDAFGSDSNDEMVFSSRLFYKVTNMGEGNWEFVSDLRDKHDFFDKLDRERLQLTDRNEFQARQINTRWVNPGGQLSLSLGRFPVQDVGAIYTDGVLAEYRWTPSLWSSFFGGKNPQAESHSYLTFNPQANIAGAGLTYQSRTGGWARNFYLTNGVVSESYGNETDRSFLFHEMNYQWEENSRILSLMYFDFVPRSYIQNGSLIWQQEYTENLSSELGILAMDSIEYYRHQGIRETLPPSPYQEAQAKFSIGSPRSSRWTLGTISGHRAYDQKNKTEVSLSYFQSRVFAPNWDLYAKGGNRNNFVSTDTFFRTGAGYFSRKWEFSLDVGYATEKHEDGTLLHPLEIEFSVSNSISRTLFWTGSIQRATDESVTILTSFFKLGYRFGEAETAPRRDAAPLRGPI
ncbi:MAG TPA: hypothetical protein VIG33_00525 [Pseudobdellovibrionaceae bacterium]|jgi:hypothetical protein